jgi:acyl-CoA reductase-like NAD-dependent aldehyde dehydrogenase
MASDRFDVISPVDNRAYTTREYATDKAIQAVLDRASQAQSQWQALSLAQRQVLCRAMIAEFCANKDIIAQEICWQMGRPIRFAGGEVDGVAERAGHMIEIAEAALEPLTLPATSGFTRFIKREALGSVLVIAPWNYPYLTAINTIVPALLAGNCVLLKHSAQTPLCAERLVAAAEAAGFPGGVFQYIHANHQQTEKLIGSNQINHVAFTGSVVGGAIVERAAAGKFKSIGLELGGKDPAYVRADADLCHAVETVVDGAFFNSGQSCCGIERAYVHQSLFDDFVSKAVELVQQYVLGPPDQYATTLGPLVRPSAAEFVRGQVAQAIAKGAKQHVDTALFSFAQNGSAYMAPQLLTQVDHSMALMKEESFGPVLGVQAVKDDKEAIAMMNDSNFGLTAALFTQDEQTGLAIGEQVQTGTFFINRCDYLDPGLAWTGVKQSGRGCTLSQLGFDYLTRPKSFHLKKVQ